MITAPTEQPMMDKTLEAAYKMMGTILQPDLVAITAAQVFMNTNVQTGKRIAVPEYGANAENAHRIYSFIRKRLQPGLLKTATELIRSTMHGGSAIGKDSVGTSFATPKVAHIAAKLKELYPSEGVNLIRAFIAQGARLPGNHFKNPTFKLLSSFLNDISSFIYSIISS